MKKIISFIAFIFLVTLLVAYCRAPAAAPIESTANENTPTSTPQIEFTPIPIHTAEPQANVKPTADFPTPLSPTTLPGQQNVISFAPNGTYTDISDSIGFDSSKTYTVKAIKGQIMSISILPQIPDGGWGYIPMQIKGLDGSILCPQSADSECIFWRGVLPSSQDYFLTLTPNGDVPEFIMRVAINPPGKDAQYFQYNNPATGLSLTYPDTFAPAIPVVGNYKTEPELALHFIDTGTYEKTNLSEAYLFISSTPDSKVLATCAAPNQSGGAPEQFVDNAVVNGFTFVHSTSEGAGAGNYYEQEIYRMVNKKICYEVIYFTHSTNIGNYPPGVVTEFDRDALMQKFYSVFSTFTIK